MLTKTFKVLSILVITLGVITTGLSASTKFPIRYYYEYYNNTNDGSIFFNSQVKVKDNSSFVVGYMYNEMTNKYKSAYLVVENTTNLFKNTSDPVMLSKTTSNEYLLDTQINQSEDYIVVGSSSKESVTDFDGWLAVLDKNNPSNKLLEKKYESLGEDVLTSVVENINGGYTAVGYSIGTNGRQEGWILRVDENGETVQSLTLGNQSITKLNAITILKSGMIVAVGENVIDGMSHEGVIVEIDSSGNVKDTIFMEDSKILDVNQTRDQKIILTGTRVIDQNQDVFIAKMDESLNFVFNQSYSNTMNEVGVSIEESDEHKIYVVGNATTFDDANTDYPFILKVDNEGNRLDYTIEEYGSTFSFRDFEINPDGNLYIISHGDTNNETKNKYLSRLLIKEQYNSVNYHANGGSGESINETFITKGEEHVVKTSNFTKEGYEFAGWAISQERANVGVIDYKPNDIYILASNDSTDFYAVWSPIKQYILTYDGNQNTDGVVPTDLNKYASDEIAIVLNKDSIVKEGYHFVGWTLDQENLGDVYLPGDEILMNENKTLFAKWELDPVIETYQVTYHANGADQGEVPVDDQLYHAGDVVKVKENTSLLKKGHHFIGWSINAIVDEDLILENSDIEIMQHLVLFAQWAPNEYQITYELDGGVNHPNNPQSFIYGIGINQFENPTKEGHIFLGWSNDIVGNELITGIDANVDTNQTIYALWVEQRENPVEPVEPNEPGDNTTPINKEDKNEITNENNKGSLPNTGIPSSLYFSATIIFMGIGMLLKHDKSKN